MPYFTPKKSIKDVWPVRNKRFLVLTDQKAIEARNVASLSTIRYIIEQGGSVVVMASFGDIPGVQMGLPPDTRKMLVNALQEDSGVTQLFMSLSSAEKMQILGKASVPAPSSCKESRFTGKTSHFASLPSAERTKLITSFIGENSQCMPLRNHSAKAIANILAEEFKSAQVELLPDCLGAHEKVTQLQPGHIAVLENLRFYAAETSPKEAERNQFAEVLASYADVFVNDAFSVSHQLLASTTALPRYMLHAAAGELLSKDLSCITSLTNPPDRLVLVLGGSRIPEKLTFLNALLPRLAKVLVGGKLAVPFLQAVNVSVGASAVSDEYVTAARSILAKAAEYDVRVVLPIDHFVSSHLDGSHDENPTSDIPAGKFITDVGRKTLDNFKKELEGFHSIFWTGPLGLHRADRQSQGSHAFAKMIADIGVEAIVGGRHTCAAVREAGCDSQYRHLFTSGIVCLQLLQGNLLPAIESISDTSSRLEETTMASVSAALRRLPLFGGCSLQDLRVLASKTVRRVHPKDDVILFEGDRCGSLWLIQSGAVTAIPRAGSGTAQRRLTAGDSIGLYEFTTHSAVTETFIAVEEVTTYQLTYSAVKEATDLCPGLALGLVGNLCMAFGARAASCRQHCCSTSAILERDLIASRNPVPFQSGDDKSVDTITAVITAAVSNIGSVFLTPSDGADCFLQKTIPAAGLIAVHEAARTSVYHTLLSLFRKPSPYLAAVLAAAATVPIKLALTGHTAEIYKSKSLINYGLTASAMALQPALAHGLYLFSRGFLEAALPSGAGRPTVLSPGACLLLAMLTRAVAAVAMFPIATRDSSLVCGSPQYVRHLTSYLLRQLLALLVQFLSRYALGGIRM